MFHSSWQLSLTVSSFPGILMSTFIELISKGTLPLPDSGTVSRVNVHPNAEHQTLHSEILPSPILLKNPPSTNIITNAWSRNV